jgi:hypothetical protein
LQTANFAIAVQSSEDEPDAIVACGDIPALVVGGLLRPLAVRE